MSEIKIIDKKFGELKIDNVGYFNVDIGIINAIEQLQKENEELKEKYSKLEDKYIKNLPCCNEEDCSLYKHAINTDYVLAEFEKWLEEKIKMETWDEWKDGLCECLEELKTFTKFATSLSQNNFKSDDFCECCCQLDRDEGNENNE